MTPNFVKMPTPALILPEGIDLDISMGDERTISKKELSMVQDLSNLIKGITTFLWNDKSFLSAQQKNNWHAVAEAVNKWMEQKSCEIVCKLNDVLKTRGFYTFCDLTTKKVVDHLYIGRLISDVKLKMDDSSVSFAALHLMIWSTLNINNKETILKFLNHVQNLIQKSLKKEHVRYDGGIKLLWFAYKCASCLGWRHFLDSLEWDSRAQEGAFKGLEMLFLGKPLKYMCIYFPHFAMSSQPLPTWNLLSSELRRNMGTDILHFLTAALLCNTEIEVQAEKKTSKYDVSLRNTDMMKILKEAISAPTGKHYYSQVWQYFLDFILYSGFRPILLEEIIQNAGKQSFVTTAKLKRRLDQQYERRTSLAAHALTHDA